MAEEVKEVSIDTLPLAEYQKARAEGKTTVEQKAEPVIEEVVEEPKDEEAPKVKGGFQKRIDRLVKHNAALEEQIEQFRKAAPKAEEPAVKADGEPQRQEFGSEIEYVKALTRWEVKQEIKRDKEAEIRSAEESRQKDIIKTYNERVSEAQGRYDDWKEVVTQDVEIPQGVGLAIMRMSNGPDVAYYLGSNEDVREELMQLDPLEAIGRAWDISRELSTEENPVKKEVKSEEPPKPKSKAPAPIKPISGGVTQSTIPLDKMSLSDYKKARASGRTH